MKKTLVALAVLAAAGSVNAAEVYNADGIVTNVSGVAEVQYFSDAVDNADAQIRLDDFDLTASTSVAVSDTLSAIGAVSLGGLAQEDETYTTADSSTTITTGDQASIDRVWVGLASTEAGTITFGRQTTILDDSGNDASFEFGGSTFGGGTTSGSDVIKYVFDNGQFYAGASVDLKEGDTDEESASGRIGFRPTDAADVVLYGFSDQDNNGGDDVNGYNLEVNFAVNENISLAASYGAVKTADVTDKFVAASASYAVDTVTYSLGFTTEQQGSGAEDVSAVYANVIKQLATNVRVYAEIGNVDNTAGTESFIGYTAGMEVKF